MNRNSKKVALVIEIPKDQIGIALLQGGGPGTVSHQTRDVQAEETSTTRS